jgi:hypothetical protein
MTTTELRRSSITLLVAPNGSGNAAGFMILDDGMDPNSIKDSKYTRMDYTWEFTIGSTHTLTFTATTSGYTRAEGEFPSISNIKIYGCLNAPTNVSSADGKTIEATINYDAGNQVGLITFVSEIEPDSDQKFNVSF